MNLFVHAHPATVHFPIALLMFASCAALLYLYWRPLPQLRLLTWWLMVVGWLGNGVAILTGLLAQSGLPPQAPYQATLNWHISTGLAQFVLYGLLLYRQRLHRLRAKQPAKRSRVAPTQQVNDDLLDDAAQRRLLTLLLLIGLALILASGWSGGQLVYQWGVNVVP
jgi:uncharacterized membrane protein